MTSEVNGAGWYPYLLVLSCLTPLTPVANNLVLSVVCIGSVLGLHRVGICTAIAGLAPSPTPAGAPDALLDGLPQRRNVSVTNIGDGSGDTVVGRWGGGAVWLWDS